MRAPLGGAEAHMGSREVEAGTAEISDEGMNIYKLNIEGLLGAVTAVLLGMVMSGLLGEHCPPTVCV